MSTIKPHKSEIKTKQCVAIKEPVITDNTSGSRIVTELNKIIGDLEQYGRPLSDNQTPSGVEHTYPYGYVGIHDSHMSMVIDKTQCVRVSRYWWLTHEHEKYMSLLRVVMAYGHNISTSDKYLLRKSHDLRYKIGQLQQELTDVEAAIELCEP